jgi:hypothetical protein
MLIVFVILQILDVLSTELGLRMGHTEGNPLYHSLGALPFYLVKAVIVMWAVAILTFLPGLFTLKRVITIILVVGSSFILLRNIIIILAT